VPESQEESIIARGWEGTDTTEWTTATAAAAAVAAVQPTAADPQLKHTWICQLT